MRNQHTVRLSLSVAVAEYGAPPKTAFAPLGYDAVMLIAQAIARRLGEADGPTGGARSDWRLRRRHRLDQLRPLTHLPDKEVTVVKVTGTTLTLAAVIRPQNVPLP